MEIESTKLQLHHSDYVLYILAIVVIAEECVPFIRLTLLELVELR
jgi:hypothetical protein